MYHNYSGKVTNQAGIYLRVELDKQPSFVYGTNGIYVVPADNLVDAKVGDRVTILCGQIIEVIK